ncbi:Pycsar system effector family protein [Flavihumibacter stibioxidans]|uniref:HD domain-containing protein n=1 Tax=Flavihumibacter stibioxidans TaxID=1834163 RepID=A0ABR7M7W5_9BACT|nr:Pycsar system effector family protein [Flavihumibacter stibioxidans]MBC6491115.1 hypothetical protein [Flavihumibacter stibioxidans]
MQIIESLETIAEQFVRQIFADQVPSAYYFHDLHHTLCVVDAVKEISSHYELTDDDRQVLLLAAWFHDTGYSRQYEDHETASVQIAGDFCRMRQVDEVIAEKVRACILATKMPQAPSSLVEEIICDADLYHLGTDKFDEESKLLRKELNTAFGKDISKKDWRKKNIAFLQQHSFFTDYARQHLAPVKARNLKELMDKDAGIKVVEPEVGEDLLPGEADTVFPAPEENLPKVKLKESKDKNRDVRTERGIATMFRIMSENHVNLSQMADSKANIMISVNTIVLSILVSVLLGKLQYYPQFIVPTIILAAVCLLAVIFAIMATRPNVNKGVFSEEDIRQKKVNLLFFGNFFKMELPDYEWAMKAMMNDSEYLYGSMIKDIYYLGKVLARKYHFLRISYSIFMFGLIIAVLSFGIAAFIR